MNTDKVFVVIPNWNLKNDTIMCIQSILAGSYAPKRIIVVDNGSSDGSVKVISKYFGKAIDIIVNEENVGFAAAVNKGVKYALSQGADWVLILNNDTIVAPDMLEQLMAVATCRPDIGILSPAIFCYNQPDRIWRLGDRHPSWSPIPFKVPANVLRTEKVLLPVDYVTGCGMLVRREVFQAIGMFDEGYFMYYEDADFCRRAKRAGFYIACVPTARMWHKISGSTWRDVSYQRYLKTRSRVKFYRRYLSLLALGYLFLSILCAILINALRGNKKSVWAYVKGFYDGWHI
jgi:GT2 family glycosyltransferase